MPPRVGRFVVEGPLARGGAGQVFRGRDPATGAPVAIKLLIEATDADAPRRARFEREAEVLRRLQHPNVIGLREAGEVGGRPFVVLDYVDGETLEEVLRRGPLDPDAAARLVRTLARAIAAAHAQGVVHRDLKPDNILVDRAGTPFVVDLGLAALEGDDVARLTRSGAVVGTLGYLAPEQAAGAGHQAGPAVDVYGLGGVLYAALTQRPPCDAPSSYEALVAAVERPPVPPSRLRSGIPPALEAVCLRCLEKDPARRFPTADALADALDAHLGGGAASTRGRPPAALLALGAALALAGLVTLGLLASPPRGPGSNPGDATPASPTIALVDLASGEVRVDAAVTEVASALAVARAGEGATPDNGDRIAARKRVLAAAEAWAAREPESALAQAARAEALVANGDLAAAEVAYGEALDRDATLAWLWLRRARVRLSPKVHAPAQAAADAERALALRPDDGAALAVRGEARALAGDAAAGQDDLERALALGAGTPETRAMLAHCLLSVGRDLAAFSRAAALADQALSVETTSTRALAARAKARLWTGDDPGAAADFARLVERGVDWESSRLRWALALALSGDRRAAREILLRCPRSDQVDLWRAALGEVEVARRLSTDSGWPGLAGRALLGDVPAQALVEAAGPDPERRCLASALAGLACEERGARDEAAAHYVRALAIDARHLPAHDWALRRLALLDGR